MCGQRQPTSHGVVVVVVEVAAEADVTLLPAEEVAAEVLSDGAGTVETGTSGTTEDIEFDVVGVEVPEVDCKLVCEVLDCAGVDVEETNGGACWTYEPSACTA